MSDESPTHRRVIERCREEIDRLHTDLCTQREFASAAMSEVRAKEATIERLTRELADANATIARYSEIACEVGMQRDAARQELVGRGQTIDALIAEKRDLVEAFHDATRLRSQIQHARIKAEDERDAARQERDAMKAMMPKPPYDADTLERAARGTYADRTVRGMARALLRLSPPSAPAQDAPIDRHPEGFCACGRRTSECDRSRKACASSEVL